MSIQIFVRLERKTTMIIFWHRSKLRAQRNRRVHGWWLSDLTKDASKLRGFQTPRIERQLWATKLKALLPSLFSNRAIRLTKHLMKYLERESHNNQSPLLFGLDDFHNVWEKMLRDVLENTEDGWNTRLPKPYFYFDDTAPPVAAPKKQMKMDIIVRQGSNLVIVDAKYYDATSVANSPSWTDISKQLMYELAMKDLQLEEGFPEEIHSCFVFPDFSESSEDKFVKIKMEYSKSRFLSKLPEIKCYYMPIIKVMQAYLDNEKITLPKYHLEISPQRSWLIVFLQQLPQPPLYILNFQIAYRFDTAIQHLQ